MAERAGANPPGGSRRGDGQFTASAGAERSATALDRFVAFSRSSDTELDVSDPTPAPSSAHAGTVAPEVAEASTVLHTWRAADGRPNRPPNAGRSVDGEARQSSLDRSRVIAGRAREVTAHPTRSRSARAWRRSSISALGDRLDVRSITLEQLLQPRHATRMPGKPAGPHFRLRIVGIVRRPLDLGNLAASGGVVIETPAFDRAYSGRIPVFTTILRVRTERGCHRRREGDDGSRAGSSGSGFTMAKDVSAETRGGQDAINVLTLALLGLRRSGRRGCRRCAHDRAFARHVAD